MKRKRAGRLRANVNDWVKRLKSDLRAIFAIQIAIILGIIGGFYIAVATGSALGAGGIVVAILSALMILGYLGLLKAVVMKIVSGFLSAFTVFLTFMLFLLAANHYRYGPETGMFVMWCCFLLGLFLLKNINIGPVKYFTYTSGILALVSPLFLMEPWEHWGPGLLNLMYVIFAFAFGYLAVSIKNALKNAFKIQTGTAIILAGLMINYWFREGMYDKTFLALLLASFGALGFLFMCLSASMARRFARLKTSVKEYIVRAKQDALVASLLVGGAFFFSAFFINLIWFADRFLESMFWETLVLLSACATLIACGLSFLNRSLSPVMDPVGAWFGIATVLAPFGFRIYPTLSFLLFVLFSILVYFAKNRGGLWGLGILACGFGVVTQFTVLESLMEVSQTTMAYALIALMFFLIALLMSIAVFYLSSSMFSRVLLVQNGTATLIVVGFTIDWIDQYVRAYSPTGLFGLGILFLIPAVVLGWLAFSLSKAVKGKG